MMILEAENLKKTYLSKVSLYKQIFLPFSKRKRIEALDSVSICLEPGQILGVVGPNGSGKTTLLKILANLLEPDDGTVSICGQMVCKNRVRIRSKIGYVLGNEKHFWGHLTGRENLESFARRCDFTVDHAKRRTAVLIKQFNFENNADQLFKNYSVGMKKKVSVMRSLLHEPSLLLFDDMTNGLDPISAKMVKEMIRGYVSGKKDCAAIWATHRLEEISQICDKVVIIDSGKVISSGFVEDFIDKSATQYMLKLEKPDGQVKAFCENTNHRTKVQLAKDTTSEVFISGINQKQFSRIISMDIKDFGSYAIFAGCVKKDSAQMFEDFQS